jgi:hypothetical protein
MRYLKVYDEMVEINPTNSKRYVDDIATHLVFSGIDPRTSADIEITDVNARHGYSFLKYTISASKTSGATQLPDYVWRDITSKVDDLRYVMYKGL